MQRHLCPGLLAYRRRLAALGKGTTHDDDGALCAGKSFGFREVMHMSVM